MTGYRVWYRHDDEPDIHYIPIDPGIEPHIESLTLQQLREATQGLHITFMYIIGDIPPGLESIAADMQELVVRRIHDDDQQKR